MKQEFLYDSEHLDNEIVDYGIHVAESAHHVRKAKDPLGRWVNEANADRRGGGVKGENRQMQQQDHNHQKMTPSSQPSEIVSAATKYRATEYMYVT